MEENKKLIGNIVLADKVIHGEIEYNTKSIVAIKAQGIANKHSPYIFSGFIDIHTHGCNNYNVMSGDAESILHIAEHKAAQGASCFLPTTITAPKQSLINALTAIKKAYRIQQNKQPKQQAKIMGIHFEGPYITKSTYRGAQNPDYVRKPDIVEFEEFMQKSGNLITLITIAPEIEGALPLIKYLKEKNIRVSVGHSEATHKQLKQGIAAGINSATHMFNGMKEFNHYHIGCAGTILIEDSMYCEVIGDGKHVVPEAVDIILRCKPRDKVMFITDSNFCSGMPDGKYTLGGVPIVVKNNEARTLVGGMAGSLVRLDEILKNMVLYFYENPTSFTRLTLSEIGNMLSLNQASFLNFKKFGKIEEGYKANFSIFNNHFELKCTISEGCVIFEK